MPHSRGQLGLGRAGPTLDGGVSLPYDEKVPLGARTVRVKMPWSHESPYMPDFPMYRSNIDDPISALLGQ